MTWTIIVCKNVPLLFHMGGKKHQTVLEFAMVIV